MNKLQQFIASKPYGFLTDKDMPQLIALDRLFQVLVRCGGCRFMCAAQDVDHLEKCIKAGGDYIRDVSFPVGSMEKAAAYVPEIFRSEHPCPVHPQQPQAELRQCQTTAITMGKGPVRHRNQTLAAWFDENDCSGAFDGFQVSSDADPGL